MHIRNIDYICQGYKINRVNFDRNYKREAIYENSRSDTSLGTTHLIFQPTPSGFESLEQVSLAARLYRERKNE